MNKDVFQERPNNTVIEMTSVSKLKDALIRTELMVPDIPDTDDKVPSWDGEVRLYSSRENFKKDRLTNDIFREIGWVFAQHLALKCQAQDINFFKFLKSFKGAFTLLRGMPPLRYLHAKTIIVSIFAK